MQSRRAASPFYPLRNAALDEVSGELRVCQRRDALAVFQRVARKAPGISYHEVHRSIRFINARERIGVISHKIGRSVRSPQRDRIPIRKVRRQRAIERALRISRWNESD